MKAILRRTKPRRPHTNKHARTLSSATTNNNVVVGIRREDPSRIWERRCPVTPDAVNGLVRDGVQVMIQPCERRIWNNDEFVKAGAVLHPTLEPANIVVGIKETPLPELDNLLSPVGGRERTHLMFSHTAKGQLYNMPLLSRFLAEHRAGSITLPRLVDYELLTSKETGKRVIGFGWFAGAAGVVEGLAASALDYLSIGVGSPFLYLPRPFSHPTLEDMRKSLRSIGEIISTRGVLPSTGPYVIGVTGNGNVSAGALDILAELPCVFVNAEDLPSLVSDPDTDLRKVYICHVKSSDYIFRKDGAAFDRSEYYAKPEEYTSTFHEKVAPYLSLLVNGAGWQHGFPRLLPTSQLSETISRARSVGKGRFRTIADISCDVGGGVEFLDRMSTIDNPFFYTDGHTASPVPREGTIQVMSVDILPSELPSCASTHFSKALKPFLRALVNQYRGTPTEGDGVSLDILDRATIARDGKLMTQHEWLGALVKSSKQSPTSAADAVSPAIEPSLEEREDSDSLQPAETSSSTATPAGILRKQRVLLLGSGMVAKPAVDEFLKRENLDLVIASNNLAEAEQLAMGRNNAKAVHLDVTDREIVGKLIEECDVVVSLLPAPFHPSVAELCIDFKKHLVTASYISPAMQDLDERAKASGILLLNEIGLDPGIDHCSAMEMRSRIETAGRRIVSFVSWCGGLPAPENSDVPLGMKFSWSPKGLLSAALNDAQFKLNGEERFIAGNNLLSSGFKSVPLFKGFALEGLANRDSYPYAETYKLGTPQSLYSLFRGTLRYQGFSRTLDVFRQMGLLSTTSKHIQLMPQEGGWSSLVNASLRNVLEAEDKASSADAWGMVKGLLPEKGGWAPLVDESLRNALEVERGRSSGDSWGMLKALVGEEQARFVWPDLEELGLIQNQSAGNAVDLPALPKVPMRPLDLITSLLSHKLRYRSGERDMVVLSHEVVTVPKDSISINGRFDESTAQTHTSTLVTYGTPSLSNSAMSRTVGLPLAFATLQVLDGAVAERGVRGPCDTGKEVWGNVLEGMERNGLGMKEKVTKRVPRSNLLEVGR